MTDDTSSVPTTPEPEPLTSEPTPAEWFAVTGSAALGIAGLALGFLGLLGVSAGSGFAQLFGLGGPNALRDTVVAQAATNGVIAAVGVLVSVAGSGRARRAGERVPGFLATAGLVVSAAGVLLQLAVVIAAYAHNPAG